jgi:hypothetical protein
LNKQGSPRRRTFCASDPFLLIEQLDKILKAKGIVKIVARNPTLIQVLKVKNDRLFHTIYTDMTQIIL